MQDQLSRAEIAQQVQLLMWMSKPENNTALLEPGQEIHHIAQPSKQRILAFARNIWALLLSDVKTEEDLARAAMGDKTIN